MKKLLIPQALAALVVTIATPCLAEWHEFTSKDGEKTLWAEVQSYDAKSETVSLLLKGNKRLNAPVSAFIEEDKTFVEKASIALEAGRNLWVEAENLEEQKSEARNASGGFKTVTLDSHFKFEILNNSKQDFNGLKAEYQIFYGAYDDPFSDRARSDKVQYGAADIPQIGPREEASISTGDIGMTRVTRLPKKECAGGS
jgi:hypothetical protein